MKARIRQLIASFGGLSTDVQNVQDDADLYRVGLKSHACVELMLALEDEFQIEFSDEMLTRATFRSVNAIEKAVEALCARAAAA